MRTLNLNPRKASQLFAPPSEFEMFLECFAAQNLNPVFKGATISELNKLVDRHLPSAEDLDRVAEEDKQRERTAGIDMVPEVDEPGNEHGYYPELHAICANCRCPITRDLEYELHLPAEGQRWYHDDYVDGTPDGHCDGVSCKNETDAAEATCAEPEVDYETRVRG